ncbi:hypothetical protein NUW58_g8087 [Xylaria curta]|uniref:Uncharacterized protein n=1 Tax=Xylaria curta TaxID=42375 RepID=A0ACC1ND65_9PEZI|nr:hypothetical protein NUW58_g8087 [Xylaria curta]
MLKYSETAALVASWTRISIYSTDLPGSAYRQLPNPDDYLLHGLNLYTYSQSPWRLSQRRWAYEPPAGLSVSELGAGLLSWQFVFAYGLLSSRTLKQWYGIDHNASPREDLAKHGDAAVRSGKITQKQLDMLKRNESAHANSVENYALFAAALGFATFAGVKPHLINRAGLLYTVARFAYGVVYIFIDHDVWSQIRGVTWWTGSNWCNFAYALTPNAQVGSRVIAAPGAKIRTHYKLNSSTNLWDQKLYVNGQLVSSVSTSQGQKGDIFYVSTECAVRPCAAAPAHSWEDISVILSSPNPDWKRSGSWNYGATGGEMATADGGKTWTFSKLNIPSTNP